MTDTDVRVVLITAESMDEASRVARALVEEKLAACCNIVPQIRSIYEWEGQVQDDPEVLLIVKTTQQRLADLTARATELHSYDVPEVIALPITGGSRPYLDWVADTIRPT